MKNTLIILFVGLSAVGCSGFNKKPEVITKTVTQNIYVEIPKEFLTPCDASKPPNQEMYLKLNASDKEYELAMYSTNLLVNISKCNIKINKLKEWNTRQREVFMKTPIKDENEK